MQSKNLVDSAALATTGARIDFEFADAGRRFAICRYPDGTNLAAPSSLRPHFNLSEQWQRVSTRASGEESLAYLLRGADPSRLRLLLARDENAVHRLDDFHVRLAIARRLLRGVLRLFERQAESYLRPEATAGSQSGVAEAATISSEAPLRKASSMPREPLKTARGSSHSVSRMPSHLMPPKPYFNIDQDRQAGALVAAADNGNAFCEECERALKARLVEELVIA